MTPPETPMPERYRYAVIGLICGMVLGVFFGWTFHGLIGLALRLSTLLVLVIPFAVAWYLWRKSKTADDHAGDGIPEANWRDIGSS